MPQVQQIGRTKVSTGRLGAFAVALVCALVSVACMAIPMYVIRPFRPQGAAELDVALAVRHAGPWVSGVCAVVVLAVVAWAWGKRTTVGWRAVMAGLLV